MHLFLAVMEDVLGETSIALHFAPSMGRAAHEIEAGLVNSMYKLTELIALT